MGEIMITKLYEYAYCGDFNKKIRYLATICEHESWYYDAPEIREDDKKYAVLWQYIQNIFSKHALENKIVKVDSWSILNTGLMTPNAEDIYMLFEVNPEYYTKGEKSEYFFNSFYNRSDRDIPEVLKPFLPEPIDFFEKCPELMYFDTRMKVTPDFNHIYDDNMARLPAKLQELDRESSIMILNGALEKALRKVKRNNRIVVPQFYQRYIQYLLPLYILGETIPLVLEKQSNEYRANTILTLGMAYNNARLLMKPESSWLQNKKSSE